MDLKSLAARSFPHERLFAGYLAMVALMIFVMGAPIELRWLRLFANLALAAVLLCGFPQLGESGWKGVLRHWLPMFLLMLVYTELDVLNRMFTPVFHDATVVAWEQSLFGTQVAIEMRKWFPFRPLSEYLHLAYFSYYFLFPILGISLFTKGKLQEFRYAATVTLAAFFICYTIFIVFPVGGPWNHFVRPTLDEVGNFLPSLVHAVLVKGESVGTAFPSSHVAAALTIWLAAARVDRRVFILHAFLVPALIIGTMYGGFHYAIDVVVGVAIGAAVSIAGPAIFRALGGGELARSRT